MRVRETKFNSDKTILKLVEHHIAIAVMLSGEGVEVNENGRKIVKAGTLLGDMTGSVVKVINSEKTQGVLLHDVDVTEDKMPATMVIHGFIDITKIPKEPSEEAQKVLTMIKFL